MLVAAALVGAATLWIAYAAQCRYTTRAQVSEGLNLSAGPKVAVAEYHAAHGRFPATNADADIDDSIQGRFVSDVRVSPGGMIQVTYGGHEANEAIAGKVLTLRAVIDTDTGELSWSCDAPDIARKHIPASCGFPGADRQSN